MRLRIISAAVLLPLVIIMLYLGGWWLFALLGLVLSIASWEYAELLKLIDLKPWYVALFLTCWLFLLDATFPDHSLLLPGLVLVVLIGSFWVLAKFSRGQQNSIQRWALTIAGGVYLGLLGSHFLRLRALDNGFQWCLVACGSTWIADSAAFWVGRAMGKNKLAPTISPGKTWEGYLGGILFGTPLAAVLAWALKLDPMHGAVVGLLVAAISPIGDLLVSMIKRQAGSKDSGKLIPGHGGFLDRIDSLLISVTLATYYVGWIA